MATVDSTVKDTTGEGTLKRYGVFPPGPFCYRCQVWVEPLTIIQEPVMVEEWNDTYTAEEQRPHRWYTTPRCPKCRTVLWEELVRMYGPKTGNTTKRRGRR